MLPEGGEGEHQGQFFRPLLRPGAASINTPTQWDIMLSQTPLPILRMFPTPKEASHYIVECFYTNTAQSQSDVLSISSLFVTCWKKKVREEESLVVMASMNLKQTSAPKKQDHKEFDVLERIDQ